MTKFSLVVPAYNERAQIITVCRKIISTLEKVPIEFEIIVVDDNSPDFTWKLVQRLAETDKRIKLIRRKTKKGLASAIISGWFIAKGDILGVIDADLQHPPNLLSAMLNHMLNNKEIEIVIASRKVSGSHILGWNNHRKFMSQLATLLTKFFIPKIARLVKDPMSGFFILRRKVILGKEIQPLGYKILLEIIVKGHYKKICEIPYVFKARKTGKSKIGFRQCLVSFFHIIKLGLTYFKANDK